MFAVYCAVAVLITGVHAAYEYQTVKGQVGGDLQRGEALLKQSLTLAVWTIDIDQIGRLIEGVVDHERILGVRVVNERGELLAQHGAVPPEGRMVESDLIAGVADLNRVVRTDGLFSHHFLLQSSSVDNGQGWGELGEVWLYSHPDVVLNEVGQLFSWIVMAALLKTTALWMIVRFFGKRLLTQPLSRLLEKVRTLPIDESELALKPEEMAVENEIDRLHLALDSVGSKLQSTLHQLRDANAELSNSNWQLQRAMEQSPASLTIFSAEGDVLYTNPAFTRISGYTQAEAQQAYLHHLLQYQSFKRLMQGFSSGEITADRVCLEVENQHKDGRWYWVEVALSPVRSAEGIITHFLSSATDISLRKQAEDALTRKTEEQQQTIAKLEEAHNQLLQSEKMASIGQLAAGVAHEINNPIGYVNSNLGSLRNYIDDLMALVDAYHQAETPEQKQQALALRDRVDFDFLREDLASLLAESAEGLERVKQIIKDLKDFSHSDSGDWVYSDLQAGLESTLNVVWNEIKYKAEVVKEYQPLPAIQCMPSQLNQVFMNLLVNAAHAIETQGVITLRTGCDAQQVWVEVEDTGKGIAAEHLPRLFEPFFTTKPIGKGTGLGLSVSYGIVKKHHGQILVDSNPGQGSTFKVVLPIVQLDQPAEEAKRA